jgi:Flp pilus assembly protein TadB
MQQNLQGNVNSLATLQESANANQYIATVLQSQQSSLDSQNNTVRQQQFKLRDELMHAQYLQKYYETATNVLILSMIVILILLIPAALWRIGQMSVILFSAIVLVVILVYLCLMVYVSSTTARRIRDSWYQFDWGVDKSMQSELAVSSCSS